MSKASVKHVSKSAFLAALAFAAVLFASPAMAQVQNNFIATGPNKLTNAPDVVTTSNYPYPIRQRCIFGSCPTPPVHTILDQPNTPDFCTADSECLVIQDSCGKKMAVNQRHAGLGLAKASQTCAEPEDKRPVSQLSCQNNHCTLVLDNYAGQ